MNGSFSLHIPYIQDELTITTLLLPLFPRFSHLWIQGLIYADFLAFVDLPPESLPSLETLDISIGLKVKDQTVFRETSSLRSAHNPRDVTLAFYGGTTFPLSALPLPWEQLTTISVEQERRDWNTMSFLLEHCSSMTHLNLTIQEEFNDGVEPLIHERLDWDTFFLPYTFPSLVTVKGPD